MLHLRQAGEQSLEDLGVGVVEIHTRSSGGWGAHLRAKRASRAFVTRANSCRRTASHMITLGTTLRAAFTSVRHPWHHICTGHAARRILTSSISGLLYLCRREEEGGGGRGAEGQGGKIG